MWAWGSFWERFRERFWESFWERFWESFWGSFWERALVAIAERALGELKRARSSQLVSARAGERLGGGWTGGWSWLKGAGASKCKFSFETAALMRRPVEWVWSRAYARAIAVVVRCERPNGLGALGAPGILIKLRCWCGVAAVWA